MIRPIHNVESVKMALPCLFKNISKRHFTFKNNRSIQSLLTLIEYILVQLMQVFEPIVLLEFLLDTLDSTVVLSFLHVALKLCK